MQGMIYAPLALGVFGAALATMLSHSVDSARAA